MKSRLAALIALWVSGIQFVCATQTWAESGAAEANSQELPRASSDSSASTIPKPSTPKSDEVRPATPASDNLKLVSDSEWLDPAHAAANVDQLAPHLEHVRIASPTDFIPSQGPFSILVFKEFVDKNSSPRGEQPSERLSYRALIVGGGPELGNAAALLANGDFRQAVLPVSIWPERATRGTTSSPGTDFKADEPPDGKTLLHLDANIDWNRSIPWLWQHGRVYVIGASGTSEGGRPRVIGSFETVIADKRWAAVFALLACMTVYLVAAFATYKVHQTQRVYDDNGNLIGQPSAARSTGAAQSAKPAKQSFLSRIRGSTTNRMATIDKGHGPLVGTNYKTIWAHIFNPVVLSAGPNGLGSATNLQILFFSLIVFGVVSYIWMMTGHLTGLSATVVLLMGISGVGATAAAGADLATNRLSFDNWAWLINRGWLPPGGVAEVNAAKWKDIFTTNGAFDVYRFQMICFSVVVGASIIGVGSQVNDLTSFQVPEALLGILGLSQVVYVAGKLVAPPSVSDLDTQITQLQNAESKLRELNETANSTLAGTNVVTWTIDKTLSEAQKAYADYLETWELTKTMFQTTIGRLVPETAASKRPPFALSDIILNKLPDAAANKDYLQTLILTGIPGPGPYTWSIEGGSPPSNTMVQAAPNKIDGILCFTAADAARGEYRFTVRVRGPAPNQTITKDFFLKVV